MARVRPGEIFHLAENWLPPPARVMVPIHCPKIIEALRDRWLEKQESVWGFEPEPGDRDAAPIELLAQERDPVAVEIVLERLPKPNCWNRKPQGRIHGTQGLANAFPAILRQCRKYAGLRAATLERMREGREEQRKEMEELEARRRRHRQELARAKAQGRSMYRL